jgi:Bacterial regulatory protein, arsR family
MALDDIDEEVYSTIFNALRHGVRRNILRMLEDRELTHTEIAENLGISSSHLTYHLDALKDLVTKTEHGYKLSRFGEAAVQMTKTVENPPEPQIKPEDKTRLKNITLVLGVSILIIAGATAELYYLSSQQNKRVSSLGEIVVDIASKLDQYETIESIIGNSTSIIQTNGRELTFKTSWILDTLNPRRFIMIFYVPSDNQTLCIETALNKPEYFYFPLTLQEGNAYTPLQTNTSDRSQHTVLWSMNVTSRFETIKIPVDHGWYSLSWVGPVSVDRDGSVMLYIDWGPRDMWMDVDASLWSYCQLRYNGTITPFLVDTAKLFHFGAFYSSALDTELMDG